VGGDELLSGLSALVFQALNKATQYAVDVLRSRFSMCFASFDRWVVMSSTFGLYPAVVQAMFDDLRT
jgi:hypothetical protein